MGKKGISIQGLNLRYSYPFCIINILDTISYTCCLVRAVHWSHGHQRTSLLCQSDIAFQCIQGFRGVYFKIEMWRSMVNKKKNPSKAVVLLLLIVTPIVGFCNCSMFC